jgi:membrane protein insertase Oxa1/YidC/SpoIIIJ
MAYSFNNSAKLQLLMPKLKELQEELKTEVAVAMKMKGWSPEHAMGEFRRNVSFSPMAVTSSNLGFVVTVDVIVMLVNSCWE